MFSGNDEDFFNLIMTFSNECNTVDDLHKVLLLLKAAYTYSKSNLDVEISEQFDVLNSFVGCLDNTNDVRH
mgnify:FL=1